MKVLIDIKDDKADFVMELIHSFSFIKTETLTPHKAEVLEGIQESVEEMKLIRDGKLTGRTAEDLFNEL